MEILFVTYGIPCAPDSLTMKGSLCLERNKIIYQEYIDMIFIFIAHNICELSLHIYYLCIFYIFPHLIQVNSACARRACCRFWLPLLLIIFGRHSISFALLWRRFGYLYLSPSPCCCRQCCRRRHVRCN